MKRDLLCGVLNEYIVVFDLLSQISPKGDNKKKT